MRCKQCGYALWNIGSRACPECGLAFKPSDFDFIPGSIQFCCPSCDQAYYGSGPRGHLEPSTFDCVKCARALTFDDVIARPRPGIDVDLTGRPHAPWMEPRKRGPIGAWWSTCLKGFFNPQELIAPPGDDRKLRPLLFAILTSGAPFALIFVGLVAVLMIISGGPGLTMRSLVIGAFLFIAYILLLFAWIILAHVALRITGNTQGDLARTLQPICLTCAPAAATIVLAATLIGIYLVPVGLIWWTTSAAIAIKRSQNVSAIRAAFAAVTAPTLAAIIGVGLIAGAFYSTRGAIQAAMNSVRTVNMRSLGVALTDRLDGVRPTIGAAADQFHSVELIIDQQIPAFAYSPELHGSPNVQRFDGKTLVELVILRGAEREAMISRARSMLGPNPVAHRMGSVVFVYHGLAAQSDPALWTAIYSPMQPAIGVAPAGTMIGISRRDGTMIESAPESFAIDLKLQNELRATLGLPPIPDPQTVKEIPDGFETNSTDVDGAGNDGSHGSTGDGG